jgi:hypothetical protein
MASTNLLLAHTGHGSWEMSTVKDRNRIEMEHEAVENFAYDYLRDVAGWVPVRSKKKATAEAAGSKADVEVDD